MFIKNLKTKNHSLQVLKIENKPNIQNGEGLGNIGTDIKQIEIKSIGKKPKNIRF